MKKIIILRQMVFVCLLLCTVNFIYADDKSPWDFSVGGDFAFYPKSDFIAGDDHFAPVTAFYGGLEARVVGSAGYTIAVPFSDNPLVSGNRLHLYGSLELTPVSLKPSFGVSFSPIAFLDFNTGFSIGSGWDFSLLGIQGIGVWNNMTDEYDSRSFKSAFAEAWCQGTFMFDLAALVPGDWNHIVTMNIFKVSYSGLTAGGENGTPWLFQGAGGNANGLKYYASFLLGYQMPLVLQTVAVQVELDGYFDGKKAFDERYHDMNPDFMGISISPVAMLEFTEKDVLLIQLHFSSRRSFYEAHTEGNQELDLTYVGREWFFNRIAFSYTHSF